jgi:dethiobiotin synthetase
MARPVFLIGTGTSVGKTYVAERTLRALGATGRKVVGYKPVESGVLGDSLQTDIRLLATASTFHVKPDLLTYTFAAPISPHLAARREGRTVDPGRLRSEVLRASQAAEALLVELPGGAFSPLTDELTGADFVRGIPSARTILVAPDRLGVLHDITATILACGAIGLPLEGIVLNAPAAPDESTGSNADCVRALTGIPLLCEVPRGARDAVVGTDDPIRALLSLF